MAHYPPQKMGPNPFEVAIDVFKQFFTNKPEKAISAAVSSPVNSWFVLMGVAAILTGVFSIVLINQLIESLFGLMGLGGYVTADDLGISTAQMFIQTLLIAVATFFVYAGAVKLVFNIYKIDISFVKVMDLVGAAYIPIILAIAAAILVMFVSIPAAFVVLVIGSAADWVFLYKGMQDYAGERASVLWGFFGMIAAIMILSVIAVSILTPDMGEFFEDLDMLFWGW